MSAYPPPPVKSLLSNTLSNATGSLSNVTISNSINAFPVYSTYSTFAFYDNAGNLTTPSAPAQTYFFAFSSPTSQNFSATPTTYMNSHAGLNVPYTGLYSISFSARFSGIVQSDFFISKNAGIALNNFATTNLLADGGGISTGGASTTAYLIANTDYVSFGVYFLQFTSFQSVVSAQANITLLQRTA